MQLLEVFRLADAAGEAALVNDIASRLAAAWVGTSRSAELRHLLGRAEDRKPSARVLMWAGRAEDATGTREHALAFYARALPTMEVGQDTALDYYDQALPLLQAVGDRAGQAVTMYNQAMILRDRGSLAEAVALLEVVVELDRQVQHPDLASDTAVLAAVQAALALALDESGDPSAP